MEKSVVLKEKQNILPVKNLDVNVPGTQTFENMFGSLFQVAVIGGQRNININMYTNATTNTANCLNE